MSACCFVSAAKLCLYSCRMAAGVISAANCLSFDLCDFGLTGWNDVNIFFLAL